jgi:hypothetical protein
MTAQKIHNGQWIAENNVIRPRNPKGDEPYERDCICSDCLQDNKQDELEWDEFESFAKQHTYATDLPNGIYQAEQLGEVVWQIEHTRGWSTIEPFEVAIYANSNAKLRKFLTTKPMSKELTPTAGLQVGTPEPLSEQKQEGETNITTDDLTKENAIRKAMAVIKTPLSDKEWAEIFDELSTDPVILQAMHLYASQHTAKELADLETYSASLELDNENKQVVIDNRDRQIKTLEAKVKELEAENERLNRQGFDE